MKYLPRLLSLLALASAAHAQSVPVLMNFQSRVTDTSGVPVGNTTPVNRDITLRIYDAPTAGNILYSEHQIATIAGGDFSLLLGAGDSVGAEPKPALNTVFGAATRYLGVTVDDGTSAADVEITPRQQIVSTAFAFASQTAQSVPAAFISSTLSTNGITTAGTRMGINAPDIGSQSGQSTYRFTVRGDDTDTSGIANQIVVQSESNSGQRKLFMGYDNANNFGSIQAYDEGGAGPSTLVLNAQGGRVGIGQIAPTSTLHLRGAPSTSVFALQAAATGSTFADQLFLNRSGTIKASLQMAGTNGDSGVGSLTNDFFVRSWDGRLILQTGGTSAPGAGITVSTGNFVGIGEANPSSPLTIRSTTGHIELLNGSVAGSLSVSPIGGVGGGPSTSLQANNGFGTLLLNPAGGEVHVGGVFQANGGARFPSGLNAQPDGGGVFFGATSASHLKLDGSNLTMTAGGTGAIVLNTGTASRVTIASNGNVGIGTTNPGFMVEIGSTTNAGTLNVQTSATSGVSATVGVGLQTVGGNHAQFRLIQSGVGEWRMFTDQNANLVLATGADGSTNKGYFQASNGSYIVVSDQRLKEEIKPMTGLLARVMQMRPVQYRFKDNKADAKLSLGFLAQEVEPLFPEVVDNASNGYKAMSYTELVPVAIGAIKEVNTETQHVKEENAALKKQVGSLEERLKKLEALMEKQAVGTVKAE